MKNVMRIVSLLTIVAMFGYTMFVFNNLHKELMRIDRNVQELVSDIYKREEKANTLLMTEDFEDRYERY